LDPSGRVRGRALVVARTSDSFVRPPDRKVELIDLTGQPPPIPNRAVDLLRQCVLVAAESPDLSEPTSPLGLPTLREALANELRCAPDELAVTSGVRSGVAVLAPHVPDAVIETPSFEDVPRLLQGLGVAIQRRSWDEIVVDRGDRRSLWITHPARNPDGADVDAMDLNHIAGGSWGTVIVNEVYRWHGVDWAQPPPIWSMVGSMAKVFGPGARIGWIRGPIVAALSHSALRMVSPAPLLQSAWAGFLSAGGLDILRERAEEESRMANAFRSALGLPAATGPNVLLPLPAGWTADAALAALRERQVLASPGAAFGAGSTSLRFCLCATSMEEAHEAADICASVVSVGLREPS